MAVVYRHIRLDKNEPFYIGIGENIERAYTKRSRNKYWKHIVKNTQFLVEFLMEDITWQEACEKEKEFIKLYGRKDKGTGTLVNMTDGGDTPPSHKGKKRSDEFKLKCSISKKNKKFSDEHVMNLSLSHKGYSPSLETRNKLSEVMKGRILTDDWKEKIKQSNIGKKRSEETKQKLREAWIKRKEKLA